LGDAINNLLRADTIARIDPIGHYYNDNKNYLTIKIKNDGRENI
jgi:hypothetical protein